MREVILSSLRCTLDLRVGLEEGESRMLKRGALIIVYFNWCPAFLQEDTNSLEGLYEPGILGQMSIGSILVATMFGFTTNSKKKHSRSTTIMFTEQVTWHIIVFFFKKIGK